MQVKKPANEESNLMDESSPSPFYYQMINSEKFRLDFQIGPSDEDTGPYWGESGELILIDGAVPEEEDIEAVSVGDNRYRLAEKQPWPSSHLRLNWGDEFIAERVGDDVLKLSSIVMPQSFVHYELSGSFSKDDEIAKIVHKLYGGWQRMGLIYGIEKLTLTVPVDRADEFLQLMKVAGRFDDLQLEEGYGPNISNPILNPKG